MANLFQRIFHMLLPVKSRQYLVDTKTVVSPKHCRLALVLVEKEVRVNILLEETYL